MEYTVFTFNENNDLLLAYLLNLGFESFQEEENLLHAYVDSNLVNQPFLTSVDSIAAKYQAEYTHEDLENINWNASWEASFQPVLVDDFCVIRATFHEQDFDTQHSLTIDPKMAFGTGHHETTFMMIKLMSDIDMVEKSVFDYGCGTGILAIMAEKLKASHVDAVDIEWDSYDNTIVNAKLNNCEAITAYHGTIQKIGNTIYDVVLANINRNVLIANAENLMRSLIPNGVLLLSGIMLSDKKMVLEKYQNLGFGLLDSMEKGDWCALKFVLFPE